MKQFFTILSFFILCNNLAEAQTYANIPGPENVLVVYKIPKDENDTLGNVSKAVMEYYVSARNIPAVNVLELELVR